MAQYYTEVLGADSDSMGTLSILSGVTDQTDIVHPENCRPWWGLLLFGWVAKPRCIYFFSVAFGAVPGAKYWSELREAVESGLSTQRSSRSSPPSPNFWMFIPKICVLKTLPVGWWKTLSRPALR